MEVNRSIQVLLSTIVCLSSFAQNLSYKLIDAKAVRSKSFSSVILNTPNAYYEIRSDIDLNRQNINLPEGCYLHFSGGRILNGTIKGRILNDYVRPEWFGAKGDGKSDDTNAIQNALLSGVDVRFSGDYCISSTLHVMGQGLTIEKNASIKAIGKSMDYMFKYGKKAVENNQPILYLDGGGLLDCNNLCGGIFYESGQTFRLQNLAIYNIARKPALLVKNGYMESYNIECRDANKSELQPQVNVDLQGGSDHKFDRWTIITKNTGIKGCGGSSIFTRVHVWGGAECGFVVNGNCTFNMCYTDWCKVGFKVNQYTNLCILNHNTIGNADECLIYSEVPVVKGYLSFAAKLDKGIQLVRFSDNIKNGECLLDVNNGSVALKKGFINQRPVFPAKNKDAMSGFIFYDKTLKKMILFNGESWVNMDGSRLK